MRVIAGAELSGGRTRFIPLLLALGLLACACGGGDRSGSTLVVSDQADLTVATTAKAAMPKEDADKPPPPSNRYSVRLRIAERHVRHRHAGPR
jgi:hypothetical protein